ncbi:MAG: hypothetical protein NZ750_07965 [Anaerolineae bacterium]|nr:hypothetical protein [Anaerolineae bacterium]MDW8172285.1 hypothetical protein [Anaerolineae bacterium]
MQSLLNFPPIKWANEHPRLAAWIVLSLGMVTILLVEARDVGLLPGQWFALIAATVGVAGLCVWIVSWEDKDDEAGDAPPSQDAPKT